MIRPFISFEYPSVPHGPPQFNTSFPHKDHTFSAPKTRQFNTKIPRFNTKNPSVPPPSGPHQKPLSSTPKPPQFHTKNSSVPHKKPLNSTPKPPQFHTKNPSVQNRDVWISGVFGIELRDFGC